MEKVERRVPVENSDAKKYVEYSTIVRPESLGEAVTGKAHNAVECDDHISEMVMLTHKKNNEALYFDAIGEDGTFFISNPGEYSVLQETPEKSMLHFLLAQTVLN